MTPSDMENEVTTLKSWYVLGIVLRNLAHKFGELSLNVFLGICLQAQI